MNEFYKIIVDMKADQKYISALKKRAKTKNPRHALAKTKEYHKRIGMGLFEFIDKMGILREIIFGGVYNFGAFKWNGLEFENNFNILIFNEISEKDMQRVEAIYNAWKNKTVPYNYGSNASEWHQVATYLGIDHKISFVEN